MKSIGLFLVRIKDYLVLTVLIITSLVMIFSNDNIQLGYFRAIAIGFIGTIQSGVSAVPNVFELEKENKFLREKNIQLSNEIASLKEAKLENIRLTKLLTLKDKNISGVVSARIINKSLIQTRNTITLNVGENDSIHVNMPVITDDGLVGRIVGTSKSYSIAQILYNKDLTISVKTQRSRIDGLLTFDGFGNIIVTNIPKAADVVVGDLMVTSEYSSYFPQGIPIGVVSESGNLDNLFKKIIIRPVVNFNTLEEVFVLKYAPAKEKVDLEKLYKVK